MERELKDFKTWTFIFIYSTVISFSSVIFIDEVFFFVAKSSKLSKMYMCYCNAKWKTIVAMMLNHEMSHDNSLYIRS